MKKIVFIIFIVVLAMSTLVACAAPSATSNNQTTNSPSATSTQAVTTSSGNAKPQGELIAALATFGGENLIPWLADNGSSQICDLYYDMLTYWDEVNKKYIPGLAESWETSSDALTMIYHLRKGIQWQDGWGELTAEDIKYNFEMQGSPKSVGQTATVRNISSMEITDPYTLVIHFKRPAPTFAGVFSFGNGGTCQGIVSKKYVETVGNDVASEKPVSSGPYKLIDFKSGSYYKFEALESHWRVVPEFKTLTVRMIPEISTIVAALKNKEVDLASVTPEQMADLKAAGIATEVYGDGIKLITQWGGIAIPEDSRYDPAYHNKDPWTDVRVRKAMAISIDRQAICDSIYSGGAAPVGMPLYAAGTENYQYPYDPEAAKQLLKDAGYPNGFSFRFISSVNPGMPETPRVVETVAAYWQQIGLDPKITMVDYNAYGAQRREFKTAGDVALFKFVTAADMFDKSILFMTPDCPVPLFQDEASYAIWKEGSLEVDFDKRSALVDKLNQYFYDNYGPIPIVKIGGVWAWNPAKVSAFAHPAASIPYYLEYVRHAQPLNTFRLFTPFPGR